jgi:protein O-GlcNAc transferase
MPSLPLPKGPSPDVSGLMQAALEHHHQGRLMDAERLYTAVLKERPDHFDALQMLGVIKLARGEPIMALQLVAAAMRIRSNSPQVRVNHGMVLHALNRHEEALAEFDAALKLKGRFAEAHNNRGSVLIALNRCEESLENFRRAIATKPDYAEAYYNQGNAQRLLSQFDDALKSYDRALALRPHYAKAHCNRGAVIEARGRPAEALVCFDRALSIDPNFPEAMLNRCGALRILNRTDEATRCLDQLLAGHPDYAAAHYTRGMMLADANRANEAVASYQRAAALKPDHSRAHWASCMATLPILYADQAEIGRQRAEYERRLRALRTACEARRIPADMSQGVGMAQPFFLAYQGHNDRELQRLYGELASGIMAERYGKATLATPPKPDEPIRVAIVSGFFWQHSVWKIGLRGWVTELDRQRFQVFGYHTNAKQDGETAIARQACHKFVQGPHTLPQWRELIQADRPHVIIYPEIGMNHEAAEIAALRLAPVQCSYIGHPQTCGFPTIDYFLSGALIEPPDGAENYTETLIKLPNIGFHYEPPDLPAAAVAREEIGLRPGAVAYWCAQSLFKYLPQYDDVFPRIAGAVGDCQFVFIRHMGREVTELFERRLERAFATAGLKSEDHCLFLAPMEMNRFQAASAQCDAMLDSIGWSGGNTTLEALAQDLPVVTIEGTLMRGRVSAGMLRMMAMPETIATTIDDYVALAVRLGRDPTWRAAIKQRIVTNRTRLYRDPAPIAALQNFLERVARSDSPTD